MMADIGTKISSFVANHKFPIALGAILFVILVVAVLFFLHLKKKSKNADTSDIAIRISLLNGQGLASDDIFNLEEALYIGSNKKCDISIRGEGIEPQHARIVAQNDRIYIEDLQSKRGVYVGGMRIQDRNVLRDKDVVGIGNADFEVNICKGGI